jgi:hypothetical protein
MFFVIDGEIMGVYFKRGGSAPGLVSMSPLRMRNKKRCKTGERGGGGRWCK